MADADGVRELFNERIEKIDFELAKADVFPFVPRKSVLDVWSRDFFRSVVDDIVIV